MNCPEAEIALLESLDHPLVAPEQHALDGHLATCPACNEFAAAQRTLDNALRTRLQPAKLDASFNTRVLTQVAQIQAPTTTESRTQRLQIALAEHDAFLGRLNNQSSLALRSGLLDGVAATTVGLGALLAAQNAWPRLETAVAAVLPAQAVSPTFALACLLALGVCLGAGLAVKARLSGASLWTL